MRRILILSEKFPEDLTSGRHLRVNNLCHQMCDDFDCSFVGLSHGRSAPSPDSAIPFGEVNLLDERPARIKSRLRYFRLSNARYLEMSRPDYFRNTVARVQEIATSWGAEGVVSFAQPYGEIPVSLTLPAILDNPDCDILTTERRLVNRGSSMSNREFLSMHVNRLRQMRRDRKILRKSVYTTTISEPDAKRLRGVTGLSSKRIIVVPNGVSSDAHRAATDRAQPDRSIVFWGNLDFPPNWTAVSYFYEEVFLPYLADSGIKWYIVGGGAGDKIKHIGKHPMVHLAGFQEDLFKYVANMGAMINPMKEGSGLKNKVLEAFALGIPVVSTSLGVDAIDGRHEEHFLVADSPQRFSNYVANLLDNPDRARELCKNGKQLVETRYTWSAVGSQFNSVVSDMLARGDEA